MYPNVNQLTAQGCLGRKDEKVCRSRGGESCAFDGAMIVLQPIADAAHIVHGPIACLGNSWEGRGSRSTQGVLDRMGFTTDLDELDIVYGSDEKLYRAVLNAYDAVNPKAIFIYATCVSGLTGEDIDAVARRASTVLPVPVIPVNAPGFAGPKNLGNRIAGEVLLEHVIGMGEPEGLTGTEINLIGEYNIAGDLWLIEPLLEEAGIRILSRMTGNASFEEITKAHWARLNVMVCSRALINVATKMERRWGIPYIEASFFGPGETTRALRSIARALGNHHIEARVERIIEREEVKLHHAMKEYEYFRGRRAVLYSGGVKSWSMASALLDMGFELAAIGTKKSTAEDEEKMRGLLGPNAPLVEDTTPKNLLRLIREHQASIMVAGGRNLYLGAKEGFPFIDVNQERHTAYAGYEGFLNLARDIDTAMRFYSDRQPIRADYIEVSKPALSINPLKHSQSLGAVMALQGVHRALPVLHGAQGCTFLGKVLLTKHFRDPIALLSTKLFAEDVVMGSEDRLSSTVRQAVEKQSPALVGILTTGLTEAKGDYTEATAGELDISLDTHVLHVSTPDYHGGLEDGYAATVSALIRKLVPAGEQKKDPNQIAVLAGPHMSPEDFNGLREVAEAFGLKAILVPDLSALDGSRKGFSGLAVGGTTIEDIAGIGSAGFTLAIGGCMEAPAQLLRERTGVEYRVLRGLTGLADSEAFMETLAALSGRTIPEGLNRRRLILRDAMRDTYLNFGGKRVCLALEPSHAEGLSRLIHEMGARTTLCVIPQKPGYEIDIWAERVVVGSLSDIKGKFDLIVSNSHAADTARDLCVPLYQAGFPSYKVFGTASKPSAGFRGTLSVLCDLANLFMEVH